VYHLNHRPKTVVILHSLAVGVEQVCARSTGAPSVEELRPRFCTHCGELARDSNGMVRVQGHGLYSRQVRGWNEGWVVVWVRRYWCRNCQRTMSRLPDWLHPWRWYAATVIIEALYRYLILGESAREISNRFGRSTDHHDWPSLRRWCEQLLVSPTLWGWLGKRLGVESPAQNEDQGRRYLMRFFGQIHIKLETAAKFGGELCAAVRGSLRGLLHNRGTAWPLMQFRPEPAIAADSGRSPMASPTEKDAGRDPPA
jgi:Domain of unknown function (DUF6431)